MTIDTRKADTQVIQCRNCRTNWDATLNFCGRCGQRLRGSTSTIAVEPVTPPPTSIEAPKRRRSSSRWLVYGALACCLVLLLAENVLFIVNHIPIIQHPANTRAIGVKPSAPIGTLWFQDISAQGDGIALGIQHLPPLTGDYVYMAWLLNAYRPDDVLAVGPLVPDQHGTMILDSSQLPTFNPDRQNLRLRFTQVLVTIERAHSTIPRPVGSIVLRGEIPPQAFSNLAQLFVNTTYTPAQIALLPGLRAQMNELARWLANLSHAQQTNNANSIHSDLLRFIYIIEGNNGSDTAALHIGNMPSITGESDGFGLLSSQANCQVTLHTCGYIDAIRSLLHTLSSQKAIAPVAMQHLLTTLANIEQLLQSLRGQVMKLMTVTTVTPTVMNSLTSLHVLSDELLSGTDRDGDGSIDPVPGEASVAQLYTYLQQVGAIPLVGV